MRIKYFVDTDTAHIEFTGKGVVEAREVSENIYIDIILMCNYYIGLFCIITIESITIQNCWSQVSGVWI